MKDEKHESAESCDESGSMVGKRGELGLDGGSEEVGGSEDDEG
jgi:hypothetical protein